MVAKPAPCYRGDGPYVFVSYAHDDGDTVLPEIAELFEHGINVWYDDGIGAGSVWRDELARAIEGATLFLFFVSPRAVESKFCRDELDFASAHDVPILAVYLTPTRLSGGMDLTLSGRQAVMRYELDRASYRDRLLAGIRDQSRLPVLENLPADPRPAAGITRREGLAWGLGLAAVIAVAGLLFWRADTPAGHSLPDRARLQDSVDGDPVGRFEVALPEGQQLAVVAQRVIAVSRDGRQLAYVVANPRQQIYLRGLDSITSRPVAGTEGATSPFFSPNGRWLGFWKGAQIFKVAVTGGTPVALCGARRIYGAHWGQDDRIAFGQAHHGVYVIPASGGEPSLLVAPDPAAGEIAVEGPRWLPGGRALLFTVLHQGDNWNRGHVVVQNLDDGTRTEVVRNGTDPRYTPTGHVLFVRDHTLLALPFDDPGRTGQRAPVPVLDKLRQAFLFETGAGQYDVSDSGVLVWAGAVPDPPSTLVWVDRKGAGTPLPLPENLYLHTRLSPDGRYAAVDTIRSQDVWVYEFERGATSRLTTSGTHLHPIWTADSRSVVFDADQSLALERRFVDGTRPDQRVASERTRHLTAVSASPDGRMLAVEQSDDFSAFDIGVVPLDGSGDVQPILDGPFREMSPMFSPNGDWLAYVSDESGRNEVYVRPYPSLQGRWQVSTGGGSEPVWSRDGSELFYRTGQFASTMMAVPVETGGDFHAGEPHELFTAPIPGMYMFEPIGAHPTYDVSLDGERFLMTRFEARPPPYNTISVAVNWFGELGRLVPATP